MKYLKLIPALAILLSVPSLQAEEEPKDSIRILNVLPDIPLERGVEVELKIDVEALLETSYEGMSLIGFNTQSAARMTMLDRRKLSAGAQRFTYVVKVIPVDWGDKADFEVLVNMGPRPEGNEWHPTASVVRKIEVTQ